MGGLSYTYIIIGLTALISFYAWSNGDVMFKSFFIPNYVKERNEWWRFITHGFTHADQQHLIFNMLTLFFFGPYVESAFTYFFGNDKIFVLFYLAALVVSSLPSYFKHKDNYRYRSLGASGAVSAVLFAAISFNPWMLINFIIPGILFGAGYIWYSARMSKQNSDNIGHDAHLWGAVFGFVFPFLMRPFLLQEFLNKMVNIPYFQ